MLGFCHELPVRTGGVIAKAGIAAVPISEDHNQAAAFFDEALGGVQGSRLFFQTGSLLFKQPDKLSDLMAGEAFSDNHSTIHQYSSGKSIVVADRSASVMIQIFVPSRSR